ncbi:DNA-binding transcriptional regulator, LysR family [Microbulbifer donghaiensis]|uniref:DNA-binding transcriptional regulator, LysR family n=1 Tax=Microbulbifer donghaiensis TaxID=494016 RepID=A0A1M4UZ42_9GAMM|nr:LysR family transcriptional regulator [Microbulbifer donghaiensis]SHE61920.1 DNA-binding transcriptional regulator, LysR family [Microbulbifer donghaiensis]
MLTLKHLRHLDAIIQQGTIHGAAERLHLSQPALTRSLNTLEEALGVKLFDRSKSGMAPTGFCQQIAGRCRELLLDLDEIQREADLFRHIEFGDLHISVGRAIKELIVRNTLPEFVARYPGVSVTVSEGNHTELVDRIKRREADILLAGSVSYRSVEGLRHEPLRDIPLSIIVGPDHPLRGCAEVQFDQLAEYPLIAATSVSPSNPLLTAIDRATSKPAPQVLCGDHPTLKSILLRTNAWLPTPEIYFKKEIETGELCRLDLHHPAMKIELSVIELVGRSRSPAVEKFLDICRTYLESVEL